MAANKEREERILFSISFYNFVSYFPRFFTFFEFLIFIFLTIRTTGNELIIHYHGLGYTNKEILGCLLGCHKMSLR